MINYAFFLDEISFARCELENNGFYITFEAISNIKTVKKINYSANKIDDYGVEAICRFIGGPKKPELAIMNFNDNTISNRGLKRLLRAIEARPNNLSTLLFQGNHVTDDGASHLSHWLKKQRMRDVTWSMNLV